MNKKNFFGTLAVAAVAVLAVTSCDKSQSQMDNKSESGKVAPTETKIAFVEVDSIMTQYKFCKEYSLRGYSSSSTPQSQKWNSSCAFSFGKRK